MPSVATLRNKYNYGKNHVKLSNWTEGILKLLKPVADAITAIEGDNKNLSLVMKVFSNLKLSFEENLSSSPILKSEEDAFRKIIPGKKVFSLQPTWWILVTMDLTFQVKKR
ncbi:uncharacterized protein LOC143021598 [Oratosquilla oratoria]|uniref:uncharacterized protein LOC143021598 n=1 Tax=Oratosquilla oratoria TaxID=337810 RepID=UPI003F777F15